MAAEREPLCMADVANLLSPGDRDHVPIRLCLDDGRQCVIGTAGEDRDPYAWLRRFSRVAPVVHLQQTDEAADHHWPFTPATNAIGRIDAARVLAALAESGAEHVTLVLEIIPPFEATDADVLEGLEQSVGYWRENLQHITARLGG